MSIVEIKSYKGSFEEKIFYISQAQRIIILEFTNENIECRDVWIDEYIDDIYLDSLNNEFKSFYLEKEDGYGFYNKKERRCMLKEIITKSYNLIHRTKPENIELLLKKETRLDKRYFDIKDIDHFIQKEKDHEKNKHRLLSIYNSLLEII
ncbi:hypothetical protein GCE9029_02080 [Grimontia celer]|uniref:Uncharacterized protein n=1 Tax=Grimontia celer TaxID=1796497 RepID=A0A128F1B9_9GAMM|nr:hypothetical protein [Grimontia celer]CZF80593.1 hypothetical protein GCE9029_02080 [Grimontia celer]